MLECSGAAPVNLEKVRSKVGNLQWQIFNIDIEGYAWAPEDDVFYLYDPCAWPDVVICPMNPIARRGRARHTV